MSSPILHVRYAENSDSTCSVCAEKMDRGALVLSARDTPAIMQHVGCMLGQADESTRVAGMDALKPVSDTPARAQERFDQRE